MGVARYTENMLQLRGFLNLISQRSYDRTGICDQRIDLSKLFIDDVQGLTKYKFQLSLRIHDLEVIDLRLYVEIFSF